MSGPALEFIGVRVVRAGRTVLDVPALTVPAGRLVVVQWENGAGKSTLLLAAGGVIDLARGCVRLFGTRFHRGLAPAPKRLRGPIALVLQEPWLAGRTVREEVDFALHLHAVPAADRVARTNAVLSRLDLDMLADRSSRALSGGERRLTALAQALALRPRLLLLDEVTSGLSTSAVERVEGILCDLVAQQGVTILLASHDPAQAARLHASRVMMEDGRVVTGADS